MTVSVKAPTSTTGSIQLNGSDVLTIDSSGNLTAPNNLTVTGTTTNTGAITSTGGIYLGGTAAANLLDDYEEGTWTPNIGGTTSNPTVTYLDQDANYIKIGNLVHVWGTVYIDTISGGSGQVRILNVPFTIENVFGSTAIDGMGYCSYWTQLNTAVYWLGCWAFGGNTELRMNKTTGAVATSENFNTTDLKAASQFRFACLFKTA